MKELKFRSWDKRYNKMIDVKSIEFEGEVCHIFGMQRVPTINRGINITDVELMQYTGIKDRNGKEIYEGDILDENMFVKYCDECKQFQLLLSSLNDDGSDYCLACNGDMHWYEIVSGMTYEVIDNIYENPELLEAK